jgi:exopolysaccharide biosynthesis polyprenyl glycosylphosphotransferase
MTAEAAATVFPSELHGIVSERTIELLERRGTQPEYRRRGWIVRRALLAADVAGLLFAFAVAESAFRLGDGGTLTGLREPLLFLAALPVWVLTAKLYGLYERDEERTDNSTTDDFGGVFHMITIGTWALVGIVMLTGIAKPPFGKLMLFWAIAIVAVCGSRATARAICRRHVLYLQNTVILGIGEVGQTVARKLLNHPEYGINLVGFVDTAPLPVNPGLEAFAYLGPPERLDVLVALLDVERVIIAYPQMAPDDTLEFARTMNGIGVQVDIVPRLHELITPGLSIHTVEGLPLIGLPPSELSRSSLLVKRAFDLVGASMLLALASPLLLLIALRIKLSSPGPVFFRQQRMGAGDRPFEIFKFRTMRDGADAQKGALVHLNHYSDRNGNGGGPMTKFRDDPRVTPFGRILRRHFLDELPQLINVVRGEMSLVGPRPLVLEEDEHVDTWGRRRLSLKPGMTGIWQVLGRNDIGFEEMVQLDYGYVTTWSLWEDLRLIFRTLPLVLSGSGGSL